MIDPITMNTDTLNIKEFAGDPFARFRAWLEEAARSEPLYEAMTLSTVSPEGKPSTRLVLLKNIPETDFLFFTNYTSRKAVELENNPAVALNFHWKTLERQVRVEGIAEKASAGISDDYFSSRPEGSRIAAWISPQSHKIPSREYLSQAYKKMLTTPGKPYEQRPGFWGGYRVVPQYFEFWQGRENRLHDRICYRLRKNNTWEAFMLAP